MIVVRESESTKREEHRDFWLLGRYDIYYILLVLIYIRIILYFI